MYLNNGILPLICVVVAVFIVAMVTWLNVFQKPANSYNAVYGVSKVGNYIKDSEMFGTIPRYKFSNEDFLLKYSDVYDNITCVSDSRMTDTIFTRLTLRQVDYQSGIRLVKVSIDTYNGLNQSRSTGGDVIVMWAEQEASDGRVPGIVTDQWNGRYSGIVRVLWPGKTVIKAKLLSTVENICLRKNSLYKYGITTYALKNPWGIKADYRHKDARETGRCSVSSDIYGVDQVCNFTTLNDGKHWYCAAPTTSGLFCDDIYHFRSILFNSRDGIHNRSEKEVILVPGHGVFEHTIHLPAVPNAQAPIEHQPLCSTRPMLASWTGDSPSGYVLNGSWHVIGCDSHVQFNIQSYRKCLANKHVYILGDSTFRQYMEYLVKQVLSVSLRSTSNVDRQQYHSANQTFRGHGITATYKKHEMPLYTLKKFVGPVGVTSLPTEIGNIARSSTPGDRQIVIVGGANNHFQAQPLEEYRLRMRYLSQSIKQLLREKPEVTVLIKGPHITIEDIKWFDSRISLLYRDIIYAQFKDIKQRVIYLDQWSISIGHNSELLHPVGDAFRSQIHQLMSYICTP